MDRWRQSVRLLRAIHYGLYIVRYSELRDYTITILMLDTGIRTSELLVLRDTDYSSGDQTIVVRQEVSKTGRSSVHAYQLCHSFATFYLQNGGDLFTLQRQMGHSDLRMTGRYTEVSDDQVCKSHSTFSPSGCFRARQEK